MKFSNTIKTVLKIYKKYVKNSVWFGTGGDQLFNFGHLHTNLGIFLTEFSNTNRPFAHTRPVKSFTKTASFIFLKRLSRVHVV